ncbi:hypothetical protein DINM_003304 [Dirofilaria immitis]|nr:hypothetical protein [Dirofilaria immitis]
MLNAVDTVMLRCPICEHSKSVNEMRQLLPLCPVSGCDEPLSDSDTGEICDGCKKTLLDIKYIITKCCNARYCHSCAIKKLHLNLNTQCMGIDNCEGKALNCFPSNGECEHDICIDCLDKMLIECETTGSPPMCPNNLCHQSYTKFEISPNFTVKSRRMEVKCELQGPDESNQATVIYDRKGNVADFIREMRRALKILPLDKIYGYYIRRENEKSAEKTDDRKPDEELIVDAKSIDRPISELNLTPDCIVVVDTSGIVQIKSPESIQCVVVLKLLLWISCSTNPGCSGTFLVNVLMLFNEYKGVKRMVHHE